MIQIFAEAVTVASDEWDDEEDRGPPRAAPRSTRIHPILSMVRKGLSGNRFIITHNKKEDSLEGLIVTRKKWGDKDFVAISLLNSGHTTGGKGHIRLFSSRDKAGRGFDFRNMRDQTTASKIVAAIVKYAEKIDALLSD